jgi:protein CpxP
MSMKKQLQIIGPALALAVLIITVPVLAQRGQVLDQRQPQASAAPRGQAKAFGRHRRQAANRLLRQLDLTEEQKGQIRSMVLKNRDAVRALRQSLRDKAMAMREAARTQPFDEAQVRAHAQEVASLRAELMVARARLHHEMLGVLTPEQKAKFDELRQQRLLRLRERRLKRLHQPGI